MLQPDEYGFVDPDRWDRERIRFADNLIWRRFPHLAKTPYRMALIDHLLETQCIEIATKYPFAATLEEVRNGFDYEHFVAQRLREQGWEARVTQASGDQGADIIASRGRQVVAIQCKYYTSPVGNKAVQEAVAARAHYQASQAAVIAPSGFTMSAKQLAATNNVTLLHHEELDRL
ncbi:restriction endonuclease [Ancylobacter lacus]|nr:restriction endonuclease [Ancylobacter lacus]